MKILSKEDILKNEEFYINEILLGKVFIYPTDTVYGLGVNALNNNYVNKINIIKKRRNKFLLVIAPNINWILKNTFINDNTKKIINQKLPGQYSFILNLKNTVNISMLATNNFKTIGIRIPNCWFYEIISKAKVPFITTSVNLSGQPSAIKISEINKEILNKVDYIISDDSILSGKSSIIIDLSKEKEEIIRN